MLNHYCTLFKIIIIMKNWFDRSVSTSTLQIGGVHIVTIKKRKEGDFPFYFHKSNNLINYNGGFKTMSSAKKHVEKRLRDFARSVEADSVLSNWNDDGMNRLFKLTEETRSGIHELSKSIEDNDGEFNSDYFDSLIAKCDEALLIINDTLKKKA